MFFFLWVLLQFVAASTERVCSHYCCCTDLQEHLLEAPSQEALDGWMAAVKNSVERSSSTVCECVRRALSCTCVRVVRATETVVGSSNTLHFLGGKRDFSLCRIGAVRIREAIPRLNSKARRSVLT